MYKKILITFYYFGFFFLIFFSGDYFISKKTNLFKVKKDCFNYKKINHKEESYYSYNLKKNCFAFEHKGKTPSYKVFTDKDGFRYSNKNEKFSTNSKIIFLGDSFTYGFGVNYEDSIPGIISQKINYKKEILNFGVPGFSPSINYSNLKEYLNNNPEIVISKVFYILDLTDVHDESNRWNDVEGYNFPIILDESVKKEIKKTFDYKNKFRVTRFISYYINNNLRNFKKNIKRLIEKEEDININLKGTYWGSFTHTNKEKLLNDPEFRNLWKNDYLIGLKKIENKMKDISKLLKAKDAEFYITIHPWRETLELGQQEFDWEKFAINLCVISECKKVINFFDDVRELKKNNPNWKSLIYFKQDLHFNALGNNLYAEKIYKESLRD